MKKSEHQRIVLTDVPRRFNFPLPVMEAGWAYEPGGHFCRTYKNKLEFCIRYQSTDDVAIDTVGGITYENKFPHLFLKQGSALHDYHYKGEREAIYFVYHASLYKKLVEMGIDLSQVAWSICLTKEINELIKKLRSLYLKSQVLGIVDEIDTTCWLLLQKVILTSPQSQKQAPSSNEAKIRQIASYISLNYNQPLDINRLIRKHGLSRSTFFRNWSKIYDKSPAQLIQDLKMEEACYLLSNNSLSIADIADDLNYSTSTYFIQVFSSYHGQTPLQYRKQVPNTK